MAGLLKVQDFVDDQHALLKSEIDPVVGNIVDYVQAINKSEYATGQVWGSKALDDLALEIGGVIRENNEYIKDEEVKPGRGAFVYIATELHKTGGHTAALFEIITSKNDCKHVIFVTNILDGFDASGFNDYATEKLTGAVDLFVVPGATYTERIKWLQAEVAKLEPEALFLFNHHEDVVAVAAAHKHVCENIYYYHHADHHLALGVYLEYAIHIDPHNIGYYNCRDHLHLNNNIYWPIVVADQGARDLNEPFMVNDSLITCTCAGNNKIEQNYAYRYKDIITGRLRVIDGVHYHVGRLTQEYLDAIHEELLNQNIDPARFKYVEWVDSIWSFFLESKIDLYISSFPLGGGMTTLECLGSGTPILLHESYLTIFHGGVDLAYKGVMTWSVPEELYSLLMKLDNKILSRHSSMGREHYLKHYHTKHLANILSSNENMRHGIEPPDKISDALDIDIVVNRIRSQDSDEYQSRILRAEKQRDEARRERDVALGELDAITRERDAIINERDAIYASKSWKMTKPLRMIRANIMRNISDD